jgi:hypothetical protein
MDLPSRIVVAHQFYDVVEMTDEELQSEDAEGRCVIRWGKIKINPKQSDDLVLETLLHEIGHAVNAVACIDDHTTEEDAVTRTTPIWMAVWRENPALLDLLTEYTRKPMAY